MQFKVTLKRLGTLHMGWGMGTEKRGIHRWRACDKVQIFWEGHKHLDHILLIISVYQVMSKKYFLWSSQKIWTLACNSKEGFNWPKLQKISSMFPDGKPVETLQLLSLTQGHQNLILIPIYSWFYSFMRARQLPDKLCTPKYVPVFPKLPLNLY